MIFKLFSLKDDIVKYDNVQAVRVKNGESNLLVLKDYVPIIGDVNGKIEVILSDTITYDNVKGYYICYNNVFNFIIEEL